MEISILGGFWPESQDHEKREVFTGKVMAIFNDSDGAPWAAFEVSDQLGVQIISLNSVFFRGLS